VNPRRAFQVLRKDLELGPRSPIFLYALIFPVVLTVLVQLVFGGLFTPQPRVGIVDLGVSAVTASYESMEGIDVVRVERAADLKEMVRTHGVDAGLVLPAGFDEAVRSGERPLLEFYIAGESLASDRIILSATTIDLVRQVEGGTPPVLVEVTPLGDMQSLPMSSRFVPFLVMFSLLIAGVFVTGVSIVEEKERRTLSAVLVTPLRLADVLSAKAAFGLLLAMLVAVVTLVLNRALGSQPVALIVSLLVAALMCVEVGLIYGAAAKDMKALFGLIKGLNVFLIAPVVFYLFPEWPQWIPKIFPTYWIIEPVFEVAINGAGLGGVWVDLLIALGICVLLAFVVAALVRRMERSLATE